MQSHEQPKRKMVDTGSCLRLISHEPHLFARETDQKLVVRNQNHTALKPHRKTISLWKKIIQMSNQTGRKETISTANSFTAFARASTVWISKWLVYKAQKVYEAKYAVSAKINARALNFQKQEKIPKPIGFVYSPLWKITHQDTSVLCTPPFVKNHPSEAIGFVYSPLWKISHQKPSVLCTPPCEKLLFLVGAWFGKYGLQKV